MRMYMAAPSPTIQQVSTSLGATTTQLTSGLKTNARFLFNGTSSKIRIGSNSEASSSIGTQAAGMFTLGANPSGSGAAYLHTSDIIILTSAVDAGYAAKRDAVEAFLAKYNTTASVAPPSIKFDGNSMTYGVGSTTDNDYPSQTVKTLGRTVTWYNYGVSSRTIPTAITDATGANGLDYVAGGVNQKNIVVYWDGTNDLYGGANATTTYNNLVTYLNARKAKGETLIVLTCLPRSGGGTPGGFEAERQSYNTLIRNDGTGVGYTVVDVAADSRIGDAGDSDDTTYYGDKVHMTDAGYAIVAGMVKTALQGLLP